jgi:hypothetical protein
MSLHPLKNKANPEAAVPSGGDAAWLEIFFLDIGPVYFRIRAIISIQAPFGA